MYALDEDSKNVADVLVELAVVIIIIGILAAFAVPRFLDSVERSKAGEAFNYLAAVRSAQERYQVRQGTYSDDITKLDIQMPDPKYFAVGTPAEGSTGSLEDSWTLTLTRSGAFLIRMQLSGAVAYPVFRLGPGRSDVELQPGEGTSHPIRYAVLRVN